MNFKYERFRKTAARLICTSIIIHGRYVLYIIICGGIIFKQEKRQNVSHKLTVMNYFSALILLYYFNFTQNIEAFSIYKIELNLQVIIYLI